MKKFLITAGMIGLFGLGIGYVLADVTAINVGTQTGSLTSGTVGTSTYVISFTKTSGTSTISGLSVSGLPSGAIATLSATSSSAGGNDAMPNVTLTINTTAEAQAGTSTFTVNSVSPALSATGTLGINPGTTATSTSTFTLAYTAGANGTLTGSTTQIINSGGSGTAVTAVPNSGFQFVNWSDASTTNPRTDTNITGNISVTANFSSTTSTSTGTSTPTCGTSTFDTFATGTVAGQGGWSLINTSLDQSIVENTFGYPTFGCKSLRMSNASTSNIVWTQVFSPTTNDAGELTALNSSNATGTAQSHFEGQFDIASALPTEQPGMHLAVSPDRGPTPAGEARMSALTFADAVGGIDVFFTDITGTTSPTTFNDTQIANDLSRATPHTIKFVMDFVEGPSNDVVQVFIDGVLRHTGTSWENFYRFDTNSGTPTPDASRTVNSLAFYEMFGTSSANLSKGFLIDNVSLTSGTSTSTTTPPTGTSTPPTSTSTLPVITLNGSSTISVFLNSVFTDPGATAVSGTTTVPVTATGTVNTAVLGGYTILYTATGTNNDVATTTRTVNVVATPVAPPVTPPASSGGGGGGGGLPGGGYFVYSPLPGQTPSPTISTVSGLSPISIGTITPTGQVLGVTTFNFTRNLGFGSRGIDVIELQRILIASGDLVLATPTQYFGTLTRAALRSWQARNGIPSTGFFGPISRAFLTR